jgi:hypothetical protein
MYNIGTNFSYRSKDFLDDRQGKATTKKDLLNWTIPVPEGFEACLDGVWYYYDSTKTNKETGHWIPRVATDIENISEEDDSKRAVAAGVIRGMALDVEDLKKQTKLLDNVIYPVKITGVIAGPAYSSSDRDKLYDDAEYTFAKILNLISSKQYEERYDINGDGVIDNQDNTAWTNLYNKCKDTYTSCPKGTGDTYWMEVGSWILPKITWSVIKQGSTKVPEIIESLVSGPVKGYLNGLFEWVGLEGITSSTRATFTFNITSKVDEEIQASGSAVYQFGYKTYTGVGDEAFGENTNFTPTMLAGFGSSFVTSGKMSGVTFNCTGGKYPYILIPKTYYSASNKTYVNDNLMSDFQVKGLTSVVYVTNNMGVKIPYVLLRTTYIQTGSAIKIEIR